MFIINYSATNYFVFRSQQHWSRDSSNRSGVHIVCSETETMILFINVLKAV